MASGSSSKLATSSVPKEFYVSVDLYLPKNHSALRKPSALARKKTDKLREKPSWLSLSRGNTLSDQWRPATCRLVEEDEVGCVFSVYLDETSLYQSVYIHLLQHTDIRHVHKSLFDGKQCLGIFPIAGQSFNPSSNSEPLYLHFGSTDLMNAWLALLRTYALPEVYGRWINHDDGGFYRMWRQVKVDCLQGRNIGSTRSSAEEPFYNDADYKQDGEATDMDVYCELYVNGILSGRTTVKKGVGNADWHESFLFPDLPPFENLEIVILREKKVSKPVVIGSILIYLMNFKRGEYVEGWFPVLSGQSHIGLQAGEMRLRLRVDEEIIMPRSTYSSLERTLASRNYLDWLIELEAKLKLKHLSDHVMSIALSSNALDRNIRELADREVDGSQQKPSDHTTLFRGNTVFTKTMEIYMTWYGSAFLETSVGSVIRRFCAEKVAFEIDPARPGKNSKSLEKNVEMLVYWCQEFWRSIYDARDQCPLEMRRLFAHIRKLVEKRNRLKGEENRESSWQSVSSFLFLRFIVPAILHPHLFGILPGLVEEPVQRSLTLIAKVIQSLANLNTSVQKEDFMRGVIKDFLTTSAHAMIDYILVVSNDEPSYSSLAKDSREVSRIMSALNQRIGQCNVLHREAIPLLPYLLDLPKHLAVVTSTIVRHSRKAGYPTRPSDPTQYIFDKLCMRCLDVEEEALHRVSQLASNKRKQTGHMSLPISPAVPIFPPSTPNSPTSPSPLSPRARKVSLPSKQRRQRKSPRPSTAPSQADSDHRSQDLPSDISVPSSPVNGNGNKGGGTGITRIISRTSISSKHSGRAVSVDDSEARSMPSPRAPFMRHASRSTSTDSALFRKNIPPLKSTSSPSISDQLPSQVQLPHSRSQPQSQLQSPSKSQPSSPPPVPMSPDGSDDPGKKRKKILNLKGILVNRR
ncbi:Ras GTPase-activating protein [Abortiporus biennis]